MLMEYKWNDKVFGVGPNDFGELALSIFRFQYAHNPVYQSYVMALGIDPLAVQSVIQIPFLPIGFFKTHAVKTGSFEPQAVFESSGTTGSINSRHQVKDLSLYEE